MSSLLLIIVEEILNMINLNDSAVSDTEESDIEESDMEVIDAGQNSKEIDDLSQVLFLYYLLFV